MSEKPKTKEVRVLIPLVGFRKWLHATHFTIEPNRGYKIIRFVLQPEGVGVVDESVVVVGDKSIEMQKENLLGFLQRIGYPAGPAPLAKGGARFGESFSADWIGASHGGGTELSEIVFCSLSKHGISRKGSEVGGNGVASDPLLAVRCDGELLKHFLVSLFNAKAS